MFCPNCGMSNDDNSMFCSNCGAPLQNSFQEANVLQQPELQTQSQVQNFAPITAMPQKPKKKKGIKVAVMAAVIMVLAVIIGVGAFTVSKLNSPLVKIGRGMKNLVTSNETYTYEISYDDGYDSAKLSADVKIDLKGKNIDAVNIKAEDVNSSVGMEAFLHTNEKEIGLSMNGINGNGSKVFYNGYYFEYDDGELWNSFYTLDMLELLEDEGIISDSDPEKITDSFFEIISLLFDVANGDADIETVEKKVISVVDEVYPEADLNENKIIKIDSEIEKQVTKELKKCLTDEEWLKENLGLSVSKDVKETVYTFDIDIDKAVNSLYDILKPLLKDVYNQTADFLGDEYDLPSFNNIADELMGEVEYIDKGVSSFVIIVAMTKNQINSVDVTIKEKYEGETYKTEVKVEISKTDNFKAPNVSDYKKDIDNVGQISTYTNDRTCDTNIRYIKANAANFYAVYGEPVSSISDIQEMFDDGQMPECPLSDNGNHYDDYIVEIASNGAAKVYCKNYGIHNHFPDSSETEAPENPIS